MPEIFKVSQGELPDRKYLFLGDYVDRGSFGTEILFYLYALKLAHPQSVYLIRGNHESRQMSEFFNFRDECKYKYASSDEVCPVYEAFIDSFQAMPIAAIVNSKYLCVHGGLSPDLHNISQLYLIDRFVEPPTEGLLCDLLWADPDSDSVSAGSGFRPNASRGCSFMYSHDSVCEFLNTNKLKGLIRAHEVQAEGYRAFPKNLATNFPSVISVFSAPNYCDLYGNKGAVLNLVDDHLDIAQFVSQPHPFHLPNFMDAFAWSVPFVCENLSELLHSVQTVVDNMELPVPDELPEPRASDALSRFRSRALAVGRMLGLAKLVRHETPELTRSDSPKVAEENETFMAVVRRDSFTERARPGTFSVSKES